MRTLFFKRKKEKIFLVLDIGTEAVKCLICKKEKSKVFILGASVQYFEEYGVFDGKVFGMEVLKKAILKAIKEAYRNFIFFSEKKDRNSKGKDWKNFPVLLNLAPDILKARIVHQSLLREKDSGLRIARAKEKAIFQQVLKKAQEAISQSFSKEFGILAKELRWICLKILEIKIDGYPVPELRGYRGKKLEFKVLAIFLPKHYFEIIKRIFGDLGLNIFKIIHIAESLPPTFLKQKGGGFTPTTFQKKVARDLTTALAGEIKDGVFLDVGGETTQFFLVKEKKIEKVNDFKSGGKLFSQKLSDVLGIDEESARILKERYANKLLNQESRKRIREIFLEEKRSWYQDLELRIKKDPLFSTVYLFGGGSLLPEISEVLKENGKKVKFIYPKDLKNIDPLRGYKDKVRAQDKRTSKGVEDLTKNLNSSQYVPSLLILQTLEAEERG